VIGNETAAVLVSFACNVSRNDKKIKGYLKNTGDKIGTGALNIILGLGSYMEGDIAGGLTITGGYVLASGLFVTEALFLYWDSPLVSVPGTIGFSVVGITLLYGFVRPFIYNRSPKLVAIIDSIQPKIVTIADINTRYNNFAVQVYYTLNF
jgi:hypothetical protein